MSALAISVLGGLLVLLVWALFKRIHRWWFGRPRRRLFGFDPEDPRPQNRAERFVHRIRYGPPSQRP